MGSCLSSSKQSETSREEKREDPEGNEISFQEAERRKTRDNGKGGKGSSEDRKGWRRKSSQLSSYSAEGKHVFQKPFSIAAFNVQRFGMSKMKDTEIVETLVRLLAGFDILLLQEVVDMTGQAVNLLLQEVNQQPGEEGEFDVLVSARVGRSKQKEQYAVFYRKNKVEILESSVYSDPGDIFSREPFIVSVRLEGVAEEVQNLTLICIHTQPSAANKEIDQLFVVQDTVKRNMSAKNIIILGDFNAGGTYIRSQDWEKNRLRGPGFTWLIPDHVDTTATNTLAAYDRIVLSGEDLVDSVVPGSAGVYRYDEVLNVNKEHLLKVSDHYPVWFCLRPNIHPVVEKNTSRHLGLTVQDRRLPDTSPDTLVDQFKVPKFKLRCLYDSTGSLQVIEIKSQRFSRLDDVIDNLQKLRSYNRTIVSYSTLASLKHQINERSDKEAWIGSQDKGKYLIILVVDLEARHVTTTVQINQMVKQSR